MERVEYLRILRKRWPVLLAAIVLGAVVGGFVGPNGNGSKPHIYTASVTLVSTTDQGSAVAQLAPLVTRGDVPQRVTTQLGLLVSPDELAKLITVNVNAQQGSLTITAAYTDPAAVARLADSFGNQLQASLVDQAAAGRAQDLAAKTALSQTLEDQINNLEDLSAKSTSASDKQLYGAQRNNVIDQYTRVQADIQALNTAGPPQSGLRTLDSAKSADLVPVKNDVVTRRQRVLIGSSVGLLTGLALLFLLERLNPRLRTRKTTEEALGLPVLSEIPLSSRRISTEVLAAKEPGGPISEAYRRLRIGLMADIAALRQRAGAEALPPGAVPPVTIMVASAGAGEGKTTTVANLAAAFADAGALVLVMSFDWHRPTIERLLCDGRDATLTFLPTDSDELKKAALATSVRRVGVVPHITGNHTPGERTEVERKLLRFARQLADVVLIDTAPLLATSDAADLASDVDLIVVTARSGFTPVKAAERLRDLLSQLRAPASGVALIGSHPTPFGYGHHKYYRGYYEQNGNGRRGRRKAEATAADAPHESVDS